MSRAQFIGIGAVLVVGLVLIAARPMLGGNGDTGIPAATASADQTPEPMATASVAPTVAATVAPNESPGATDPPTPSATATPEPQTPALTEAPSTPKPKPATPKPAPKPTLKPTPKPTLPPWPDGVGWSVEMNPWKVTAGSPITMSIAGMPRPATCSVRVVYPNASSLSLPAKVARPVSGGGYGMSWTWTVPAAMPAGRGTAYQQCSYPGYTFPPGLDVGFDILRP